MELIDLLQSTASIRARQYPIRRIGSIDVVYYKSNHQLYIIAQAFPSNADKRTPYRVSVVFSGIGFSETPVKGFELPYYKVPRQVECYIQRPTYNHKVIVRCNCQDFYFMWEYYDKKNKSLLGPHKPYIRKTTTYPPKNPTQTPGLCKHILGLVKLLDTNTFIEKNSVARNYLNAPPRNYF